jgi:antitoxin PrlF
LIETESSLTDRYQTTVPAVVRRALRLRKRDAILYRVGDDGSVTIARKPDAEMDDPLVDGFLAFLAQDMTAHPERIAAVDAGLLERIRPLVADVEVDLDMALAPEDD